MAAAHAKDGSELSRHNQRFLYVFAVVASTWLLVLTMRACAGDATEGAAIYYLYLFHLPKLHPLAQVVAFLAPIVTLRAKQLPAVANGRQDQ